MKKNEICPIRSVLANIMKKWQPLILLSLEHGARRFSEIKRSVGDISHRVLTQHLRVLEEDGYVIRTVETGPPVKTYYQLTTTGHSLTETVKPIIAWIENNHPSVFASRAKFKQR